MLNSLKNTVLEFTLVLQYITHQLVGFTRINIYATAA